MEKPDLDRMMETYIKIGLPTDVSYNEKAIQIIRFKICPMISRLKNDKIINWYNFLIHPNPKNKDDPNGYFHIRVGLKKDISRIDFPKLLPDYCIRELTKKVAPIRNILGINKSLLKNEEIEEAHRIIGEQSEWLMNMLNIHKEDVKIPVNQVEQFLHYYSNMIGLSKWAIFQITCPYCKNALVFQKDISMRQ